MRTVGTVLLGLLGVVAVASGCDEATTTPGTTPATSAPPSTSSSLQPAATAPSSSAGSSASSGRAGDGPPGFAHPKAKTAGCPDGMVRVQGEYCPGLVHRCIKHHEEYANDPENKNVSERCLEYENPAKCISKERKPLDFCMDRYEYPNKVGELPRVLTSWREAKIYCERLNKRLCTEEEFNFACEGPEGLPQVYGFERSQKYCNIDKPYRRPDHSRQMHTYEKCYEDAECKAEMDRLDQRHKIGERLSCVSWAGVVDMNGNVNEWVDLPGKKPPDRSGLKGGWWGPVRNRCRPTVTFHKESDYGYEAGFRCCGEAADAG